MPILPFMILGLYDLLLKAIKYYFTLFYYSSSFLVHQEIFLSLFCRIHISEAFIEFKIAG